MTPSKVLFKVVFRRAWPQCALLHLGGLGLCFLTARSFSHEIESTILSSALMGLVLTLLAYFAGYSTFSGRMQSNDLPFLRVLPLSRIRQWFVLVFANLVSWVVILVASLFLAPFVAPSIDGVDLSLREIPGRIALLSPLFFCGVCGGALRLGTSSHASARRLVMFSFGISILATLRLVFFYDFFAGIPAPFLRGRILLEAPMIDDQGDALFLVSLIVVLFLASLYYLWVSCWIFKDTGPRPSALLLERVFALLLAPVVCLGGALAATAAADDLPWLTGRVWVVDSPFGPESRYMLSLPVSVSRDGQHVLVVERASDSPLSARVNVVNRSSGRLSSRSVHRVFVDALWSNHEDQIILEKVTAPLVAIERLARSQLLFMDTDGNVLQDWVPPQGAIFDLILDGRGDIKVLTGDGGTGEMLSSGDGGESWEKLAEVPLHLGPHLRSKPPFLVYGTHGPGRREFLQVEPVASSLEILGDEWVGASQMPSVLGVLYPNYPAALEGVASLCGSGAEETNDDRWRKLLISNTFDRIHRTAGDVVFSLDVDESSGTVNAFACGLSEGVWKPVAEGLKVEDVGRHLLSRRERVPTLARKQNFESIPELLVDFDSGTLLYFQREGDDVSRPWIYDPILEESVPLLPEADPGGWVYGSRLLTRIQGLEGLLVVVTRREAMDPDGESSWLHFHYVPGSGVAEHLATGVDRGRDVLLFAAKDGSRILCSFDHGAVLDVAPDGQQRVLYRFETSDKNPSALRWSNPGLRRPISSHDRLGV